MDWREAGFGSRFAQECPPRTRSLSPSEERGILMKTTLLVLLLTIGLGTAFATSTTSELVIENSNGSQICSITENSGGNAVYTGNASSGLTGRVLFNDSSITISNGTFITGGTNTWALSVVDGVSGTPDADGPGLDVTSLMAVCGS